MDYQQPALPLFSAGGNAKKAKKTLREQNKTDENPPEKSLENFSPEFAIQLLALGSIKGVGVQTLKAFLKEYGENSFASVWELAENQICTNLKKSRVKEAERIAHTIKAQQKELLETGEKQFYQLERDNIKLITPHSHFWPKQLAKLPDMPGWLFVSGDPHALKEPLIGIVGTRNPSPIALKTTSRLASIIAKEGLGIVSGLAEGIDSLAHKAGLNYGVPQVAVLGTGLDIAYPASTKKTRQELIEQGGAVITEYLPGTDVNRAQFVERNRIQAGLSTALVPIEGRRQSGTQHTVEFAERYGRPLFGVIRTAPAIGNELIEVLKEHSHPIFDLDTVEGENDLKYWLKQTMGPELWPAHSYPLIRENVFRSVLSTIDNLVEFVPLNEADLEWFQDQVAQRFHKRLSKNGHGDH
jgi:DNA protecting protein DprA